MLVTHERHTSRSAHTALDNRVEHIALAALAMSVPVVHTVCVVLAMPIILARVVKHLTMLVLAELVEARLAVAPRGAYGNSEPRVAVLVEVLALWNLATVPVHTRALTRRTLQSNALIAMLVPVLAILDHASILAATWVLSGGTKQPDPRVPANAVIELALCILAELAKPACALDVPVLAPAMLVITLAHPRIL